MIAEEYDFIVIISANAHSSLQYGFLLSYLLGDRRYRVLCHATFSHVDTGSGGFGDALL